MRYLHRSVGLFNYLSICILIFDFARPTIKFFISIRDHFTCATGQKMASIWIVALISCGTAYAFSPYPNPSFVCKSLFQIPNSRFRSCDIQVLNGAIQPRRPQRGLSELVCMSKKDQRYRLAKRPDEEDQLLLAVSEQFRRREGQAQISWYPGICYICNTGAKRRRIFCMFFVHHCVDV